MDCPNSRSNVTIAKPTNHFCRRSHGKFGERTGRSVCDGIFDDDDEPFNEIRLSRRSVVVRSRSDCER